MGDLINLNVPNGKSLIEICKNLNERGLPVTILNLKSFRSIYNSRNPSDFVYNKIVNHLRKVQGSVCSFVILDKFDLWSSNSSKEESDSKKFAYDCQVPLDTIERLDGIDDLAVKCDNWVYKLLFWLKNSIISKLKEIHKLYCICIYGNSYSNKEFFHDLFGKDIDLHEFLANYLKEKYIPTVPYSRCVKPPFASQKSSEVTEEGVQFQAEATPISASTNIKGSKNATSSTWENNILSTDSFQPLISLDDVLLSGVSCISINCKELDLSNIVLIVGVEDSGKSTLLRSIVHVWYRNFNASNVLILNLEYYELSSQFVGCGEAYIRNIFNKAKSNKPSIIYFDGIDCLFYRERRECTILKTFIDQLYKINEDEDVKFICSTTGDVKLNELNKSFVNLMKNIINLDSF